ncbi:MAG: hypothetical protein GF313_12985 [Caldithrix sp.]|nr:hypothetical protein [Caldithrix sp.]
MKLSLIVILAFIFAIVGLCQNNNQYITQQVYRIDSLHVQTNADGQLTLKAFAMVPNPCYRFSHVESQLKGDSVFVTLFAKTDKSVNCVQVIASLAMPVTLDFKNSGLFHLRFLGRTTHFDTTITVN